MGASLQEANVPAPRLRAFQMHTHPRALDMQVCANHARRARPSVAQHGLALTEREQKTAIFGWKIPHIPPNVANHVILSERNETKVYWNELRASVYLLTNALWQDTVRVYMETLWHWRLSTYETGNGWTEEEARAILRGKLHAATTQRPYSILVMQFCVKVAKARLHSPKPLSLTLYIILRSTKLTQAY